MKKNILSLFLIIAFCTGANAQDKIYGGLRLSPNYSFFNNKIDKVNSGLGYSIGYFEVIELSNKINLQAEINYNTYTFVDTRETKTTVTTRFSNLELPLMVKYRVSEGFAIGGGYQFSLLNKLFSSQAVKFKVDGQDPVTQDDLEGIKTGGYFIDANLKSGGTLVGLRILQTSEVLYEKKSMNVGLYVGFTLFK